jgi:hypothetical protein
LFRFYSYGLEKKFRPEVFNDFQEETLRDFNRGMCGTHIVFARYGCVSWPLQDIDRGFVHCLPGRAGNVYGLEKFWAYLKYRKDSRPLEIRPEVKVSLGTVKPAHANFIGRPAFHTEHFLLAHACIPGLGGTRTATLPPPPPPQEMLDRFKTLEDFRAYADSRGAINPQNQPPNMQSAGAAPEQPAQPVPEAPAAEA